jgi:MFS family permease
VNTAIWSPFRHKTYSIIWTATLASNIGGWMYSSASAWLMTTLTADPLKVSLVQMAASLPMFLFALPAGALADMIDRRRFLIGGELFTAMVGTLFAILVWHHWITPITLLLCVFLIEAGSAATSPAWQAVVPALVPPPELGPALALNSIGVNVSRAVGPALGGALTASLSLAAPFWVNAVSNFGSIGALLWWRTAKTQKSHLPAERFASALRAGIRHARYNSRLRATLIRAVGFFLFASCYWALLPLVTRQQLKGGAPLYGILLGTIGLGAVGGGIALPWLNGRVGRNGVVVAGSMGTAAALLLFGLARNPIIALASSLIAGMSWIAVIANLNVSAQIALPEWVRGRGIAIYVTVIFGAMTLGSIMWGQVASIGGLPEAHFIAAGGAVLAALATWRWRLPSGPDPDLTPAMQWALPHTHGTVSGDAGPVLVIVEYRINPQDRDAFLKCMTALFHERGRDGAYGWGIFEDVSVPGRMLETFYVESWLEHLRHHERVTKSDRMAEKALDRVLLSPPTITHLISGGSR